MLGKEESLVEAMDDSKKDSEYKTEGAKAFLYPRLRDWIRLHLDVIKNRDNRCTVSGGFESRPCHLYLLGMLA